MSQVHYLKKFADDTKLAMVVEIDDDHARLTI